jgi:hypothetical protein
VGGSALREIAAVLSLSLSELRTRSPQLQQKSSSQNRQNHLGMDSRGWWDSVHLSVQLQVHPFA